MRGFEGLSPPRQMSFNIEVPVGQDASSRQVGGNNSASWNVHASRGGREGQGRGGGKEWAWTERGVALHHQD